MAAEDSDIGRLGETIMADLQKALFGNSANCDPFYVYMKCVRKDEREHGQRVELRDRDGRKLVLEQPPAVINIGDEFKITVKRLT